MKNLIIENQRIDFATLYEKVLETIDEDGTSHNVIIKNSIIYSCPSDYIFKSITVEPPTILFRWFGIGNSAVITRFRNIPIANWMVLSNIFRSISVGKNIDGIKRKQQYGNA